MSCSRCLAVALVLMLLMLVGFAPAAHAQEMDCEVSINYSQLSGRADYSFLEELEGRLEAYINEGKWTEDRFAPRERIHCTLRIYFQEAITQTEFQTRLVVASRRPVYGTAQSTPVVRFTDPNFQFRYTQGQSLIREVQRYNELTSVLDFYVYLLLGYDYDTFSELGGTPFFERARRIADLAQANGAAGWSELGGQGRAALVQQLLDPRFRPLRLAYFNYHFGGLDHFISSTEQARQTVMQALQSVQAVYDQVARQYVLDVFFATKYSELEAIFAGSQMSAQVYALLTELDPAHDYGELLE